MDFEWSADDIALSTEIHAFARRKLATPGTMTGNGNGRFCRETWQTCGAGGLLGLPIPPALGGRGLGFLSTARAMETLGEVAADRGLLFSVAAHMFACVVPIWKYGTAPQQREWLPPLCSGAWIGANAITEQSAGSDVYALETNATRDGDEYVLDGEKSFVSNAPVADVFLVYAKTDKRLGPLGLSSFVVPRSTPGLTIGEPFHTLGLHSASISTITLAGCRVPASHRIGDEGSGKAVFEISMTWERLCLFGIWLGVMQTQLERALDHAKARRQFGRPIGKNQAVSHRISDMKLRLESARWLLYRACWLADHDRSAMLDVSLAKLAVSEAAVLSSLDAVHLHGAAGLVSEMGVEETLRDVIPGTIYSGTSEMHREIIARSLGL
jgi:alkylation response protein AidB-like acyl-CoA dehydrogenase